MLRQGHRLGHRRPPRLRIVVHPTGGRENAGHERGTGRIAGRCCAVGAGKEHSACGQLVQIWRARLWMTPEAADPVVQIINDDKEYIGLGCLQRGAPAGNKKCQKYTFKRHVIFKLYEAVLPLATSTLEPRHGQPGHQLQSNQVWYPLSLLQLL